MVLNRGRRYGRGEQYRPITGMSWSNFSFGPATLLKHIDTQFFVTFFLILVNFVLNYQDN